MTSLSKYISVITGCTVLLTSGCSNFYWPEHGHSGIAEDHPHAVQWHYERAQLDFIEMKIENGRHDIHFLIHDGAKKYYPALMHDIEMQMILVEREFEGHFYKEAENNLILLQALIEKAWHKMGKKKT